MKISNEMTA